jgi:hypothetical protein
VQGTEQALNILDDDLRQDDSPVRRTPLALAFSSALH